MIILYFSDFESIGSSDGQHPLNVPSLSVSVKISLIGARYSSVIECLEEALGSILRAAKNPKV